MKLSKRERKQCLQQETLALKSPQDYTSMGVTKSEQDFSASY
jgi:hypothetical protein